MVYGIWYRVNMVYNLLTCDAMENENEGGYGSAVRTDH